MAKYILFLVTLLLSSFSLPSFAAPTTDQPTIWHYTNDAGELKVKLYFFWSKTCPHCKEAHPFIDSLPKRYPWIELEDHMISDPETMEVWQSIAKQTGTEARSVPYFASGEKAVIGYSSQAVTGEFLVNRLKSYYISLGGNLEQKLPVHIRLTHQPVQGLSLEPVVNLPALTPVIWGLIALAKLAHQMYNPLSYHLSGSFTLNRCHYHC